MEKDNRKESQLPIHEKTDNGFTVENILHNKTFREMWKENAYQ